MKATKQQREWNSSIRTDGGKAETRKFTEQEKNFSASRRKVDLLQDLDELGRELMEVWE